MLQTTDPQLSATESKELRCVAPPYRGCNTQLLAQRDPLLAAAMRACDQWADSETARQEMRRQIADVGSKLIQMVSTVNGIAPSHSKHRIQRH